MGVGINERSLHIHLKERRKGKMTWDFSTKGA